MPYICPHCSFENTDDARYCGRCGNKLSPINPPSSRVTINQQPSSVHTSLDTSHDVRDNPQTSALQGDRYTPGVRVSGPLNANHRGLVVGAQLQGRYKIEQLLAAGGMGAVYRALDTRLNRSCAVKEMLDDFQNDTERSQAVEWFTREATLLLDLNHPCIPRVRDFFVEGGKHYLVMDFIEGRTLAEVLEKEGTIPGVNGARGVSEAQARSWAIQLCNVLAYLHRQNPPIIFRDLKPSNIMVTDNDEIKLIDFGIARTFQSQRQSTIIMTIGYAPPEQLHGMPEPRSDIYALGAIIHRLLTRHDAANNKPSIFSFPPPRTLRPDITPGFDQIIMKALAPNLEQRWSSAPEMERAIMNLPPPDGQRAPILAANIPTRIDTESGRGLTPPGKGQQQVTTSPAQSTYPTTSPPPPSQATGTRPIKSSRRSLPSIFSQTGSLLERFFSSHGQQRTQETQVSLYAIARAMLGDDDHAVVGETYLIQVGIAQSVPERFQGVTFDLSVHDTSEPVWFDIIIHPSENIELTTEWHKRLGYDLRNPDPQLVEFFFRLRAPGHCSFAITFYHERRWLQTVRLEFDGVKISASSTVSTGG